MAKIPTLKEISEQYKKLSKAGSPYKTGKMRSSIATSYKKVSDFKYTLDLNMVSYGLWWNTPPKVVKRIALSKRPEFNFVVRASEDKSLTDMIINYSKAQVQLLVAQNLQDTFQKGGYSKTRQSFGK
jgi:hypothetical protein